MARRPITPVTSDDRVIDLRGGNYEDQILNPTWSTWDAFETEYVAWRKDYEASPASAGKFFSGGEILPDGSTVLEDYVYETFTASGSNATLPHRIELYTGHRIPRSRTDRYYLHAFDPLVDTRDNVKGTETRRLKFYKEYLDDIDRIRSNDPREDTGRWINNFKKITPQLEEK